MEERSLDEQHGLKLLRGLVYSAAFVSFLLAWGSHNNYASSSARYLSCTPTIITDAQGLAIPNPVCGADISAYQSAGTDEFDEIAIGFGILIFWWVGMGAYSYTFPKKEKPESGTMT